MFQQRIVRWLLLFTVFGMIWPATTAAGLNQTDDVYEDPGGRFHVPVPAGWTAEAVDGYGVLSGPDEKITMTVLAVDIGELTEGIAQAWQTVEPGFDLEPLHAVPVPPPPGGDDAVVITYDIGEESGEIVQAMGLLADGVTYALLIRADVAAAQARAPQINIVASGFTITGLDAVSLEGVAPLAFEGALVDDFEAYVETTLERFGIPGAAIAIVQDGEVVYRGAFGVTDLESGEPMTPETRMMIGSTTKSITTMMLATMVDEGLFDWDTPVVDIMPSFTLSNPELTARVTVQDLACACTGLPRYDLQLLFNASELTAADAFASLANIEPVTPFGEVFQYNNQLVAAAGYVGAVAIHGEQAAMHDTYVTEMTERVLAPIGMERSTFSFEEIETTGDHATPHGIDLDGAYVPLPLDMEQFVVPVAPSGGLWSNVDDMARYLLTELAHGTAPDGAEVVSAENLEHTWQPRVPVSATTSYGLGLFVDSYKDQLMIHHGGNTVGFTSELAFLPEANLGITLLTNGQGTNLFSEAVRYRLFELVFELEPEFQAQVDAILGGETATPETDTGAPVPDGTPAVAATPVAPAAMEPFVGEYVNDALGTVTIEVDMGTLYLDAGEFRTELRQAPAAPGGTMTYLVVDPPLATLPIELRAGDDGAPILVIGESPLLHEFIPVATPIASPAA